VAAKPKRAGYVGLAPGTVRVVPYDAAWPREFRRIRKQLLPLFPGSRIEHVGSTSVLGCAAKPLIDVSVGLLEGTSLQVDTATAAGLEFRMVRPGSVVFRLQGPTGLSIGFVHVRGRGSDPELRDLLFRDYLRAHPRVVDEYSELKRRLATKSVNRGDYSRGKEPFIQRIHSAARRWAKRKNRG
jgi:GrpB-like predicted nucleotidyltransferase (UPF0157 family)